jgi:hypothetical protein
VPCWQGLANPNASSAQASQGHEVIDTKTGCLRPGGVLHVLAFMLQPSLASIHH